MRPLYKYFVLLLFLMFPDEGRVINVEDSTDYTCVLVSEFLSFTDVTLESLQTDHVLEESPSAECERECFSFLIQEGLNHSSAAYNSNTGQEFRKELERNKYLMKVCVGDNGRADAIISYTERLNQTPLMTVAFPGTEDWLDIFSLFHNCFKYGEGKTAPEIGVHFGGHSAFLDLYLRLRDKVVVAIKDLLRMKCKDVGGVEYLLTGHSRGGALAVFCANEILNMLAPESEVNLVTFASPIVLREREVHQLGSRLKKAVCIVREGDFAHSQGVLFNSSAHIGDLVELPRVAYNPFENHSIQSFREDFDNICSQLSSIH